MSKTVCPESSYNFSNAQQWELLPGEQRKIVAIESGWDAVRWVG
jgi:hypothetical protein